MENGPKTLNFSQALSILRRRAPLIVLCAIVVAGAAFAFSKSQTKEYSATAALSFNSNPLTQQVAGLPADSSANQFVEQASNVQLVGLGDVAAKTAKKLGGGLTESGVRSKVSIAGQGESNVVAVSATATSPELAAAIATTYSKMFVSEQQAANRHFFVSALALVKRQLAELPKGQRYGTAAVALQNRAQSLQLLQKLGPDTVSVAEVATPPNSPSSPKTAKNTALGIFLGLLIGLGLAFLLERSRRDRRVLEVEDLTGEYGLRLLGTIPRSRAVAISQGGKGRGSKTLNPEEAESFRLIRNRLRFATDTGVCSVLVASSDRLDGRTTVARRLAEAAALAGSRTLLIEADLRNPSLAGQLGLQQGPGLVEVLLDATPLDGAIQTVSVESRSSMVAGGSAVDVLTAGGFFDRDPGGLLESDRMRDLLAHVEGAYSLVVIDTPTLTVASDAFPLLGQVGGVVVVGRLGHSRREEVQKLRTILAETPARTLGVVANGTIRSSGRSGSYGTGNGNGGHDDELAQTLLADPHPDPQVTALKT